MDLWGPGEQHRPLGPLVTSTVRTMVFPFMCVEVELLEWI